MIDLHFIHDIPLTLPVIFTVLQIILDLILILIVLFLLKRISSFDPGKLETLIETLKESRNLCEQLGRTVAENAEIAGNIQRMVGQSGASGSAAVSSDFDKTVPAREKALLMWKQGDSIDKIADITGLGRGEVEVITSLADQQGSGH